MHQHCKITCTLHADLAARARPTARQLHRRWNVTYAERNRSAS